MTSSSGCIRDLQDGEVLWFQGWLVVITADGAATNGRFLLADCLAQHGGATPLHRDDKDETFILLEGAMTFWLGGEPQRVNGGATVIVPGGTPFAFRVDSERARILVLGVPAGLEAFFRAAGRPAERRTLPPVEPGPPDPARLEAAAREGGVEVVGPPPDRGQSISVE